MSRKQHHPARKHLLLAFLTLLVLGGGFLFFRGAEYFPSLFELFFKKEIELVQAEDERVNLLLLGIGGGNHEGPLLTDTIIYTSIDPKRQQVTLVTIPRDLWIPSRARRSFRLRTAVTASNTSRRQVLPHRGRSL